MSNTGKRFEGETRDWNFDRNFRFIDYEDSGRRRTVFYSSRNIQADWRGSRSWGFASHVPGRVVKKLVAARVLLNKADSSF
jgi:hypothetical protein